MFKYRMAGSCKGRRICHWPVLAPIILIVILQGCSGESNESIAIDEARPYQHLKGSWEILEISVNGVVVPKPQDGRFWYFLSGDRICTLEKRSDGSYGPDFSGVYEATDSTLEITTTMGDKIYYGYSFSVDTDTLLIRLLNDNPNDLEGKMLRVFDAPGNKWCSPESD